MQLKIHQEKHTEVNNETLKIYSWAFVVKEPEAHANEAPDDEATPVSTRTNILHYFRTTVSWSFDNNPVQTLFIE